MKILIIETTSEDQVTYANRIQSFAPADAEPMNIEIKLSNQVNYKEILPKAEVVILGSKLKREALSIARDIKVSCSDLPIIMFVEDNSYSKHIIRSAHFEGIRKVLPDWVGQLDLLQELVAIDAEFRRTGKSPFGQVIAFSSPKGGAGTTTLAAALAELASLNGKRTLLWDLDAETRDLSRALSAPLDNTRILDDWMNGVREVTRESFEKALVSINAFASLLTPPSADETALAFACHSDAIPIMQRIQELARYSFDNILVDIGNNSGPGVQAILQRADKIVVTTGECPLSITAAELYIDRLKRLLGSSDNIYLLCAGNRFSVEEIRSELDITLKLSPKSWSLPAVPNDNRAAVWPASGKTLYSLGCPATRAVLHIIAGKLELSEGVAETQPWISLITAEMVKKLKSAVRNPAPTVRAALPPGTNGAGSGNGNGYHDLLDFSSSSKTIMHRAPKALPQPDFQR
jgi:cellulose biosynthesis protein BcsQ